MSKNYDQLEDINCPHCGENQGISWETGGMVTSWGDEMIDFECHECKKSFLIKEQVLRSWEAKKDVDDDDDDDDDESEFNK